MGEDDITLTSVILRATERGLCLADFDHMTLGMIFDHIIQYNNEHMDEDEKDARPATQADMARF